MSRGGAFVLSVRRVDVDGSLLVFQRCLVVGCLASRRFVLEGVQGCLVHHIGAVAL